jgi:hypothetical protein
MVCEKDEFEAGDESLVPVFEALNTAHNPQRNNQQG